VADRGEADLRDPFCHLDVQASERPSLAAVRVLVRAEVEREAEQLAYRYRWTRSLLIATSQLK
jgi:hypothetical protein